MNCNTWNTSNLKKFITEFKKIDGADIAIEKLETNRLEATYHKGVIDLPIVITQGSTSKYLVSFPCHEGLRNRSSSGSGAGG